PSPTIPPPAPSTRFPYTTLFRSVEVEGADTAEVRRRAQQVVEQVTGTRSLAFDAKIGFDEEEMRLFWDLSRKVVPTLYRLKGSTDRKSTRLNSSHVKISYAVFCL